MADCSHVNFGSQLQKYGTPTVRNMRALAAICFILVFLCEVAKACGAVPEQPNFRSGTVEHSFLARISSRSPAFWHVITESQHVIFGNCQCQLLENLLPTVSKTNEGQNF